MNDSFINRLWVRLVAAFLLVVGVAVVTFAIVTGQAVERSFRGYLNRQNAPQNTSQTIERIEEFYAENKSWQGVGSALPGHGGQGQGAGRGSGGATFTVVTLDGEAVASTDPAMVGQSLPSAERMNTLPLTYQGDTVGYLLIDQPGQARLDEAQQNFLSEVRQSLITIALITGGIALLIGIAFSHLLARPLAHLTAAARRIAAGELGGRVDIGRGHAVEVAGLADTFNRMSTSLAEADEARRRLSADVAHELRTPLGVVRGQLQGMLDDVLPADKAHIAAVYEQSLHLSRLVDDLHTLSRAESGHLPLDMQPLNPADLLSSTAGAFEPLAADAGLTLESSISPALPTIHGDADRLRQVLGNLLTNALRYTSQGGTIRLAAETKDNTLSVTVSNTGSTLTPEQASHVFDRFWRADESRQRDTGGVGLGLAIARQIVRLHGGDIQVAVSDGETCFTFTIPLPTGR